MLNPHFVAGEHGLFGGHKSADIRTFFSHKTVASSIKELSQNNESFLIDCVCVVCDRQLYLLLIFLDAFAHSFESF